MHGKIFLVPTYLSDSNDGSFITPVVKEVISNSSYFLVENARTARRFISSLNLKIDISTLHYSLMDKQFNSAQLPDIFKPVYNGHDLVIMSEAGMPGIADPGSHAVAYAHQNEIEVAALQGTSAILLALVSSGFNGQEFTFHGYLPIDKSERIKKIRDMENTMNKTGATQLFMETPYRNMTMIATAVTILSNHTYMFIGANLGSLSPICKTKRISEWKKVGPSIHKVPAIFAIGNPSQQENFSR